MNVSGREAFRRLRSLHAWVGIVCLGGLTSCGMPDGGLGRASVPVARQAAKPKPVVSVTAYFFTAPDGFDFVKGQDQPNLAGNLRRGDG